MSALFICFLRAAPIGERVSTTGNAQQGGRPAPVVQRSTADAGHAAPPERADEGG